MVGFSFDTKVLTSKGEKPIQEITECDKVKIWRNEFFIEDVITSTSNDMIRIELDLNDPLICAPDQYVRVSSGRFVKVTDLKEGQMLMKNPDPDSRQLQVVVITKIEPIDGAPVINLIVRDAHQYAVNGILVADVNPEDFTGFPVA